jgi:hypothetical protein
VILEPAAFKLIRPSDIKITKPKPEAGQLGRLDGLGLVEFDDAGECWDHTVARARYGTLCDTNQ